MADLVAAGHVGHIEARDMFGLLPSGKARHLDRLDRLADESARRRLHPIYEERFLPLNDDFKQLCTDWQLQDGEPNDYDDDGYDRPCLDRRRDLHLASQPVIGEFAAVVARFSRYAPRFDRAAACVADGDTERFTGIHKLRAELRADAR